MIALDSNILVYAHRSESNNHEAARDAISALTSSRRSVAVPWPCAHEFISTVTHPRVFPAPSSMEEALDAVAALLDLPRVQSIGESRDHLSILGRLVRRGRVAGPKIHDARIAAICLGHGVEALWTADRDFSYFPELVTHNPLVA